MMGSPKGKGLLAGMAAVVCIAAGTGDIEALSDEEIFRSYQYFFLQPGARAMGMGGAYVALSDDAAAVETNPAGLRALAQPQLHVEFGSINNDPALSRSSQGSLDVNPVSGDRSLPYLSFSTMADSDTTSVPSLVSFSYPFSIGKQARRLTVGGSRRVAHSQDLSLPGSGSGVSASFSFDSFPNTVGSGGQVEAYAVGVPVSGSLSTEIVHWNAVAAYEVHPDFSVGVTLTHARLDLETSTLVQVFDPMQILVSSSHPRLPSQPSTDVYTTRADGSDSDLTFSVGVHWHPGSSFSGGSSPWQFGASFSKGATFSIEESTFLNGLPDRTFENRIAVPDVFSVGGAYRYAGRWTFAAELERVEYSDLAEQFESGVSYLTSPQLASGAFATRPGRPSQFKVDDGNTIRLGAEYRLPLSAAAERALSGRIGWFRTPDVEIRMARFNSMDPAVNATYEEAYQQGDAVNHWTVGLGLDMGRYGFDVGFEASDLGDRFLVSYVQEWGGR